MITYEASTCSFVGFAKNLIIFGFVFMYQVVRQTTKIYYYSRGSNKTFVNEFSYLHKSQQIREIAEGDYNIISIEKIPDQEEYFSAIKVAYKPTRLIKEVVGYAFSEKKSIIQITSVLRSCLKYSFLFSDDYKNFVEIKNKETSVYIFSDPANPFVRYFDEMFEYTSKKYLCTTIIGVHSKEWYDISEEKIYVVNDKDLVNDFKEKLFKIVKFQRYEINYKEKTTFQYSFLFYQQYYHPLAFKSRFTHFFKNIKIASKNSVLTRIHPNESFIELSIYNILDAIGCVKISNQDFEHDAKQCKYALSFSSSSLTEFSFLTGRKVRNLKSEHMKAR